MPRGQRFTFPVFPYVFSDQRNAFGGGELPKVNTICKCINRAQIALEREVKEGIGRVAGNAICLQ